MKDIVERFISYTKIDTTSFDGTDKVPSSPNQWLLAKQLAEELTELAVENVSIDEHCFVYGKLSSNIEKEVATIGFLAHMDTSNATSGANIQARIIDNYDGKDIQLSDDVVTSVSEYPQIANLKGKSIIVTDGHTLLGGDDKAGIAIIMDTIQTLVNNKDIAHGDIYVCFTPDEEIGAGIHHIDLNKFPVDYAYTVDGGDINSIDYENFNAASASITFNGNSIHPGSAKNKMVNALQLAMDFHSNLPVNERPEYTEGREGFNHLVYLNGNCEKAQAEYIIRNHDGNLLEKQKNEFVVIANMMNELYGKEVVSLTIKDTYRNMFEHFSDKMYIIEQAKQAIEECGLTPINNAVRGGTDGAILTYMGVPTPNLGTGGYFCHGNHELMI